MQHEQEYLTTFRLPIMPSVELQARHMVSPGCAANGFVKDSMPCQPRRIKRTGIAGYVLRQQGMRINGIDTFEPGSWSGAAQPSF